MLVKVLAVHDEAEALVRFQWFRLARLLAALHAGIAGLNKLRDGQAHVVGVLTGSRGRPVQRR